MEEKDIREALETILFNAKYTNPPPGRKFYESRTYSGLFYLAFNNETITLLLALYKKLTTPLEKNNYLNCLKASSIEQVKLATLLARNQEFLFAFLIKIQDINAALNMLDDKILLNTGKSKLLDALKEIIEVEPVLFSNDDLNRIIAIMEAYLVFIRSYNNYRINKRVILGGHETPAYDLAKIGEYKQSNYSEGMKCEEIAKLIIKEAYEEKQSRLSKLLLEGINFEINQDQRRLQGFINNFKFNPVLVETLEKIDQKLYGASDGFDYKGCIGLIRTFLNELCISIAKAVESHIKVAPGSPIIDMGTAISYLVDGKVGFLSEEDMSFVTSFNKFISRKGVHRLKSDLEDARISKNMAIELGLYLIEKLGKYLS